MDLKKLNMLTKIQQCKDAVLKATDKTILQKKADLKKAQQDYDEYLSQLERGLDVVSSVSSVPRIYEFDIDKEIPDVKNLNEVIKNLYELHTLEAQLLNAPDHMIVTIKNRINILRKERDNINYCLPLLINYAATKAMKDNNREDYSTMARIYNSMFGQGQKLMNENF